MAYLYLNSKNKKVWTHSYSAGQKWEFCPRNYKLAKIDGWAERKRGAAMDMGNCIEAAVQAHCLGTSDAVTLFRKLWHEFHPDYAKDCTHGLEADRPCKVCADQQKRNRELTYSDKEKDWQRMEAMGVDLLRLFIAIRPTLPIYVKSQRDFARKLEREVFPGTELAGINFQTILDIVSSPPANHPLLAQGDFPLAENGARPLIIDVKTSSKMYPAESSLIALDPQLQSYAWQTGILDVAFLVFVKMSPELKRGTVVRSFEPVELPGGGGLPPGGEFVLCEPMEVEGPESWWVLPNDEVIGDFEEYTKGLKGKALEAKRMEFLHNAGIRMGAFEFTTQRIQFLSARIDPQDAKDIGDVIGQQIAEIHAAAKRDFFPKVGGIRWPNDRCLNCPMRGICAHDDKLRDELVFKLDEAWLEDEAA